jgi:RNA polymerase sigma-70 factor (ECF subfamily)
MSGEINFKEIYKEFHPKILHYVARLTGHYDCEDVTQEVFEKVSRHLDDFKGKSKLSTWVYRIATNTALDRLKSPSLKQNTEELTEQMDNKDVWDYLKKHSIDQQLIRKEMGECVREHLNKLSPDYKAVIVLSELEGFKNKEIANILQISLENVKIRLHRARSSLKKILDEACDFYHNEQNILACDRKPTFIKFKKST